MPFAVTFTFSLVIMITIIPGLYIRYLPFHTLINESQKTRLKLSYAICLVLELILTIALISTGILPFEIYTVKFLISVLWMPLFAINLLLIPNFAPQHIFILGLQSIYTFSLHSIATLSFSFMISYDELFPFVFIQSFLYLVLFGLTFPLIKGFLQNLFISRHVDGYYWKQICLLPILLYAGTLYFSIIERNIVIYEQFPARVITGLCALIVCYCMTLDLKWLQARYDLAHLEQLHKMQINSFKNQAKLLYQSQQALSIERHDMRHKIRMIYTLIQDAPREAALTYLEKLEDDLQKTAIQKYCQNLLINAVLAFYIPVAKKDSIPFHYEIALPAQLPFDESDLATVLSNLLENAIIASLKQPKEKRAIQLTLSMEKGILKLLVRNQFDFPIYMDEQGLPTTKKQGHGLGMKSLMAFVTKNKGMTLCQHKDGWFTISVIINTTDCTSEKSV